jgi:hypothetical protein
MSSCWLRRIRDDTGTNQEDNLKRDNLKEDDLTLPRKALLYLRLLKALIGGDMEELTNLGYVYALFIISMNNIPPIVAMK